MIASSTTTQNGTFVAIDVAKLVHEVLVEPPTGRRQRWRIRNFSAYSTLSVSTPRSWKGMILRSFVSASVTSDPSRTMSATHSVQPLATSVSVSVCAKLPLARSPEWATRSASTNPGMGSPQSAKVPQRDTPSNGRRGPRAVAPTGSTPASGQDEESVNRRRTCREHLHPDIPVELQMSMSFQRAKQGRDKCLEPLAADPIGGLPQHHQCLGDRVAVATWTRPRHRWSRHPAQCQQTDRVFAVVSRYRHEFVQDPTFCHSRP